MEWVADRVAIKFVDTLEEVLDGAFRRLDVAVSHHNELDLRISDVPVDTVLFSRIEQTQVLRVRLCPLRN